MTSDQLLLLGGQKAFRNEGKSWRPLLRRLLTVRAVSAFVGVVLLPCAAAQIASRKEPAQEATTAWKQGHFIVDTGGVLARSAIVLQRPGLKPTEAMPLGNGRMGAAVWSQDGFMAQLNRTDTLPYRYSPGQVVIPGAGSLIAAKDYTGRLDLYNGEFQEQGGGYSLAAYVDSATDALVVDFSGADPHSIHTVYLKLWKPRVPTPFAKNGIGILSQDWSDDLGPGASGEHFGAMSAITVVARDVRAVVKDPYTIAVSFRPGANGQYRVIAAAPHWVGGPDWYKRASQSLNVHSREVNRRHWHAFWQRAAVLKLTSADGSGEYMENLRNLYLFTAAAESGGRFPGSAGGIGELFSAVQDRHDGDTADYWHLNLRMQTAANLGAGLPMLNAPYFRLYSGNLPQIEAWTRQHMNGLPGACVPETMRFNGVGIEYEPTYKPPLVATDCDAHSKPFYNARTLSTGAEVSLWIWRQYLLTQNESFLQQNYPFMVASVRFLLAYATRGSDGLLHTEPSNAHETQWDTLDPTTDISAETALFRVVIEASRHLHLNPDLVRLLQAATTQILPLPRTQQSGPLTLLPASADHDGSDVIADSYRPSAKNHNTENIGLEPVWPYEVIGQTSPLLPLARRTLAHRPYPMYPVAADWCFDPIQAARLGLGDEVKTTMVRLTEIYQVFPNGLANWGGKSGEFFVEQAGVVATALQEALVQDDDGLIRIGAAIPRDWNADGEVWIRGRTVVCVQTRDGVVVTAGLQSGSAQTLRVETPFPGQAVHVIDAHGKVAVPSTREQVLQIKTLPGQTYRIEPVYSAAMPTRFAPVGGEPARGIKSLGKAHIGLSTTSTAD